MSTSKTITRRSRNIGIGSTSQPVQRRNGATGASWLEIESVDGPDFVGTVRQVAAEYDRVTRRNSGHDYNVSFFVGGVKVARRELLDALSLLTTPDPDRPGHYLSDSETVEVVSAE